MQPTAQSGYQVLPVVSREHDDTAPDPIERPRSRRRWVTYLITSVGLVGFLFFLVFCIHPTAQNRKTMREDIEKGLTQLSGASQAQNMFEGVWDKGTLKGNVLIWPSGRKTNIKVVSPTELTINYQGKEYTGTMHADMKLHWSDGDTWSRIATTTRSVTTIPEAATAAKQSEEKATAKKCTCSNGNAAIGSACTKDGHEICKSCDSGYMLKEGSCMACESDCVACTSSTVCTTCGDSKYLHDSDCVTECPDGYHGEGGDVEGRTCEVNTCTCSHGEAVKGSACTKHGENLCKSCDSGYMLEEGSCMACESDCVACTSSTVCTTCGDSKYLHDSDCVTECPDSYHAKGDDVEGRTCVGNKCTCSNGEGAQGSACTKDGDQLCLSCDSGYRLEDGSCMACGSDCVACTSSTVCTRCGDSKYLHDSDCVTECPGGYHGEGGDVEGRTCEVDTCTCSHGEAVKGSACTKHGENICKSCDPGHFFLMGNCDKECEEGCDKCSGLYLCNVCAKNKYLHEWNCVASCPEGFHGVSDPTAGRTCKVNECLCLHGVAVDSKDCENPGTTACKSCNSGYILNGKDCESEAHIKASMEHKIKKLENERDKAIKKKQFHLFDSLVKKIKALKKKLQDVGKGGREGEAREKEKSE